MLIFLAMTKLLLPYLFLLPSAIYQLLTLFCADRFFRIPPPAATLYPPVTVIKPVKGCDSGTYENFASFCQQDYPEFQVIFALASGDDPAIPLIGRLQGEFPGLDIRLVVDSTIHGPNLKVCNLINAWPSAIYDIIVIADSDVRVPPGYLQDIAARFADPRVGLVTNLYRSRSVDGPAAAIESLGFTTEMTPNVLVARELEGLTFALGASMSCRRKALERIGGFNRLVDFLADDYQLGNLIHRAGWKLELSPMLVESSSRGESLRTVLLRQLRWCRTMGASRPLGYLASAITQPFWGWLLLLLFADFSIAAISALLAAFALRFFVATRFSRSYVKDKLLPGYLWLLPLRDALYSLAWLLSFAGKSVVWRAERYRLLPGGKIAPVD